MEKKILENQWLKGIQDRIEVIDEASLSSVREKVREVAKAANLSSLAENVALIATELARNQLLHGKFGQIVIREVLKLNSPGIEVIAADQGKGITNPAAALSGEISTSGSLGAGLSSVHRLADELDFDIRLGEGTCIWARVFEKTTAPVCYELAIMGQPYPGESISGDAAFFSRQNNGFFAGVSDGLGHGYLAHEASAKAVQFSLQNSNHRLDSLILQCNEHMRGSRGATLSLARFLDETTQLEHLGVGDSSAHLYHFNQSQRLVMTPHILGHPWPSRLMTSETFAISSGSILIMFSDGLKTGTSLDKQLEIMRQPAVVIAQWLLDNFARDNDDSIVLVAKFKRLTD